MKHYNIVVSGVVQGVFFRASTAQRAKQLGINGWVRNEPDGTVHILAVGSPIALQAFIDWCHQGPPHAEVKRVTVTTSPENVDHHEGFEVRY